VLTVDAGFDQKPASAFSRAWAGFLAFVVTSAILFAAFDVVMRVPPTDGRAYFYNQALGFARGRLDLIGALPHDHDLADFHGRTYGAFGPLPAVPLLVFVPFFSAARFPQSYVSQGFAALAAGLFFLLVRRVGRFVGRSPSWWILAAAIAWGSSNLVFALAPRHWFLGQLITSLFFTGSVLFAMDRRPPTRSRSTALAWALYGLSILGRIDLIFTYPFFAYLAIANERFDVPGTGRLRDRIVALCHRRTARRVLSLSLAPAAGVALLLLFNYGRFGRFLDFGLDYHNMDSFFRGAYFRYGGWSLGYVRQNVYSTIVRLPIAMMTDGQDWALGCSLFAQVPVLLFVFLRSPAQTPKSLVWACWAGITGPVLFLMGFMGSGWFQFGARYLHDIVPFLVVIAAAKRPDKHPVLLSLSAVFSVLINLWGALLVPGTVKMTVGGAWAATAAVVATAGFAVYISLRREFAVAPAIALPASDSPAAGV
jgi:hypothetical protein